MQSLGLGRPSSFVQKYNERHVDVGNAIVVVFQLCRPWEKLELELKPYPIKQSSSMFI